MDNFYMHYIQSSSTSVFIPWHLVASYLKHAWRYMVTWASLWLHYATWLNSFYSALRKYDSVVHVRSNVCINVYALLLYIGLLETELIIGLTDTSLDDTGGYSDYTLCASVSVTKDVKKYLVSCQSPWVFGRYLFIRWNETTSDSLYLTEVQVYAGITSSLLILATFNEIATHE